MSEYALLATHSDLAILLDCLVFLQKCSQPRAILPPGEHLEVSGGNSTVKAEFVKTKGSQE